MSIPQSGGGDVESKRDLVRYLEEGVKPRDAWRIGTEHEKFGFVDATRKPLPYEGACSIKTVLEGLRDRFGWSEIREGGNIIGLSKDGANVSLEPGGQVELSGAPLETIHATCDEVVDHLRQIKSISDEIGAKFIGLGVAPEWRHDEMPMMPKGRYKLMTDYMDRVGTLGKTMMYRTCTVQVNLDFASESDMVQKLRVALALQPVATALFANSPFLEGKPSGYKSYRSRVWRDLDPARTGLLPFVFEDGFGFEKWVDYALDVPMYFVYRKGVYHNALGQSFRAFMQGRLPGFEGERPTVSDWADHLTTIFPEARIKRFIEMRGADGAPWRGICALPAFWVGLLYDQNALDGAWDLVKGWDGDMRESLRIAASEEALDARLDARFGGHDMLALAKEVVALSHEGLKRRARKGAGGLIEDETHFLDIVKDALSRGKTPADDLLDIYHTKWGGDLSPLYDEFSY